MSYKKEIYQIFQFPESSSVGPPRTAFKSANAYDPYIYGKKTHRFLTCDVYLGKSLLTCGSIRDKIFGIKCPNYNIN